MTIYQGRARYCYWCKADFSTVELAAEHERTCEVRGQQIRDWHHRTRPRSWQFDQYVGSTRAKELGLWPSDSDPNRTWTVPGTVAITRDDDGDQTLTVEADGVKFVLESWRDQWGTYYWLQSGKGSKRAKMAQEDGTRSFLRALIAGLQHMEQSMDHGTKDPDEIEVTTSADAARPRGCGDEA